jgi:uncharacterized protein
MTEAEAHAGLEELSTEECLTLLRGTNLGRIAFVANAFPIILPVNYRFADGPGGKWWLALRTRPGNVIDRAPTNVAFEIDGVDAVARSGWSVLVRGTLKHIDMTAGASNLVDSEPWLDQDRDSWLLIEPLFARGRRLRPVAATWVFRDDADL